MASLARLLEYSSCGQQARFERFMAQMMYVLAAGKHIDADRTEGFMEQVHEIYANPFEKKRRKDTNNMSAEEIKQYVLNLLEE